MKERVSKAGEGVAEGGQEREAISACFPAASVRAGSAANFLCYALFS